MLALGRAQPERIPKIPSRRISLSLSALLGLLRVKDLAPVPFFELGSLLSLGLLRELVKTTHVRIFFLFPRRMSSLRLCYIVLFSQMFTSVSAMFQKLFVSGGDPLNPSPVNLQK